MYEAGRAFTIEEQVSKKSRIGEEMVLGNDGGANGSGMTLIMLVCGTLIYYHCAIRNSSLVTLIADVLIVLLCSLAVLGMLFRHFNIPVPIDPLEWEVSQDTANRIAACIANVVGAAESVLRVAANGEDKKLFLKVAAVLYLLSAMGRAASGATVAYAALWLTMILLYTTKLAPDSACQSPFLYRKREGLKMGLQDGWKLES